MKDIVSIVMYPLKNLVVDVVYLYVSLVRKREMVFAVRVLRNIGRVQIMSMDYLRKYPLMEFRQDIGGLKVKRKGALVGSWLLVGFPSPANEDANTYRIFHLPNGKAVIDATFLNIDDAFGMAETINELYKDYMPIWESYPDADVIALSQWTIKNGIPLYQIAQEMAKKNRVNTVEVKQLFQRHGVI